MQLHCETTIFNGLADWDVNSYYFISITYKNTVYKSTYVKKKKEKKANILKCTITEEHRKIQNACTFTTFPQYPQMTK